MNPKKRPARPLSVTFTVLGVFFLGTANLWAAIRIAQQAPLLLTLQPTINPWLRAGLALGWGILFWILAWALHQKAAWVRWGLTGASWLFAFAQISQALFFAPSALVRQGLPANVLLYSLLVFFITWALNRPAGRRYLQPAG